MQVSNIADIDLYYWPTPNGFKVTIMLAELDVSYRLIPVDITQGEQFDEKFTEISPNSKIPALVDRAPPPGFGKESVKLFESGAILLYLAEKYGRYIPEEPGSRYECLQWLFWQIGGLGPMAGQAHHFRYYAPEKIPYAVNRYSRECQRLYQVLDKQLTGQDFVCGQYSIADIACLPWIFRHERQGLTLSDFPALNGWYQRLMDRKAVSDGLLVAAELRDDAAFQDKTAREMLFNLDPNA